MDIDFDGVRPHTPFFSESHDTWRQTVRRFVDREIIEHIDEWDEAGAFPRDLHYKAAAIGALGLGFPEEYGGMLEGIDIFHHVIVNEELARAGSGGLIAGLLTHGIGLPPIIALGSEELKARIAPEVLTGEKLICLGISEPGAGSDVANLQTRAVRDGDDYVVNGQKTYITTGMRGDYITLAARTGDEGMGGISLILVELDRPGVERHALEKMGWWCSDTAEIFFEDVRVPASNLIGPENHGFMGIMLNFNTERLSMAAQALAFAAVCIEDAVAWARDRHTFGRPLSSRQVIRHKIVDMVARVRQAQSYLYTCAWRVQQGEQPVDDVAMLKFVCSQVMEFCAREAMQILGGVGYMRGGRVERIYREVRVNAIGGGSEEIMKELASRQLGI